MWPRCFRVHPVSGYKLVVLGLQGVEFCAYAVANYGRGSMLPLILKLVSVIGSREDGARSELISALEDMSSSVSI